jgi:hypothetical protein
MTWQEAVERWRALPEAEKRRRRRASIPRKVARSFAMEGEPVDERMLQIELERRRMPPAACEPPTPD